MYIPFEPKNLHTVSKRGPKVCPQPNGRGQRGGGRFEKKKVVKKNQLAKLATASSLPTSQNNKTDMLMPGGRKQKQMPRLRRGHVSAWPL